jgi:hypothetical protein
MFYKCKSFKVAISASIIWLFYSLCRFIYYKRDANELINRAKQAGLSNVYDIYNTAGTFENYVIFSRTGLSIIAVAYLLILASKKVYVLLQPLYEKLNVGISLKLNSRKKRQQFALAWIGLFLFLIGTAFSIQANGKFRLSGYFGEGGYFPALVCWTGVMLIIRSYLIIFTNLPKWLEADGKDL